MSSGARLSSPPLAPSPAPALAVHFGGSRCLASSPVVARVVSAALGRGASVHVGCAVGADQLVVGAALAAGAASRLSVFSVGSSSRSGFWAGSAVGSVLAAAAAGARVVWSAGGSQAIPLRARLLLRSRAALVGCSVSVFFLASPSSPGSLAVAGHAVALGQSVFAFSCGFSGAPAAPRGCAGRWCPATLAGLSCWRWCPVVSQPALF
jgi:hypothetical protein